MAALIGALRASLSADTANFEAGMRRAQRQAQTSSAAIGKSLGTVKAGLAGFASGLSVGLLSTAVGKALEYAGSLGEVAQQLGVTTKELQVFRFAAQQNGASMEDADKSLGKLTLSISKALSGSKQAAAAFGAVGVSLDDLRTKSKSEIIGQIADQMRATGGASANAAAGVAIFGKGFQKLGPLLDQGSAGINDLARAAQDLGIVLSDRQIQQADETADKLDKVKTVLAAQIAGVVADNAQSIVGLASALAQLTGAIVNFLGSNPQTALGIIGALGGGRIGGAFGAVAGGATGFYFGSRIDQKNEDANMDLRFRMAETRKAVAKANKLADVAKRGGGGNPQAARKEAFRQIDLLRKATAENNKRQVSSTAAPAQFLAGGGAGKGRAKQDRSAQEAERKRLEALRDAYQFDQELRRSQHDVLRAQQDLAVDYSERGRIALQMLTLERQGFDAEMRYQVATGELTQAQANRLTAQRALRDGLEQEKIYQDMAVQHAREAERLEEAGFDIDRAYLESQRQLATTAAEQRRIQLRLLDLAYRQERARLQAVIADEASSSAAKLEAQSRLDALDTTYGADREAVIRGTRNPLEEWASSVPQTAAEITEAFQQIQVDGIDGIADALTDVISGTESLGDAFKQVAQQIIADIIRMTLRMLIFRAIAAVIPGFGGAGGAAAGAGTTAATSATPGFAQGGSFRIFGGPSGIDKIPLSAGGIHIANVSHGERISIANDNVNGGGGITINQHFAPNFAGNAATRDDLLRMGQITKAETLAAMREARRRGG